MSNSSSGSNLNHHMSTLAQDNPEVSQRAASNKMSNLQQLHVFQFGHSTGRPQNRPQQVHVHVFQFDRFNMQTLYCYLLECISLHYYALLLFVEPHPDGIKMAHNRRAELFINLVAVGTEASHIGGTAPVHELFINKNCLTVRLYIYLSLNGNEIYSVIRPA